MGRAARQGLIFPSTATAFDEIEAAHDLFWCAAVSMWNTRSEVIGLRTMAPDISSRTLSERVSAGSGLSGSNVVTATDRFTWDEQLNEIGLLRLTQLMAHYEGWLESIAREVLPSEKRRSWVKSMTFPQKYQGSLSKLGDSPAMTALYKRSKPHQYRIDSVLTETLTCLRYFKEVRNCAIHQGRRASTALLDAQAEYEKVVAAGRLRPVYRPPKFVPASSLGDDVSVSHFGVVGLTGLTQRAMISIEAKVAVSSVGEEFYVSRWRSLHGSRVSLSTEPNKRQKQIASMAAKVGPRPTSEVTELASLLKRERLVT